MGTDRYFDDRNEVPHENIRLREQVATMREALRVIGILAERNIGSLSKKHRHEWDLVRQCVAQGFK